MTTLHELLICVIILQTLTLCAFLRFFNPLTGRVRAIRVDIGPRPFMSNVSICVNAPREPGDNIAIGHHYWPEGEQK